MYNISIYIHNFPIREIYFSRKRISIKTVAFQNRNINIQDIEVKLIREKIKEEKTEKYYIQIFDSNGIGEKKVLKNSENLNKKDLAIMFNKKVKIFC